MGKKRILFLSTIMVAVALTIGITAIWLLYGAAFNEQSARLVEVVQSRARMMEAVAGFNQQYSSEYPGGGAAATVSQTIDAHKNFKGFGETGEFTLARREGDQIVFLLSHRHHDLDKPHPVPFDGDEAEPMRRALSGQSGTVIGLDYRGATVLAAYEPVKILDLGVVAKIDMAEVRAPFIKAGYTTASIAFFIIATAVLLFFRVSEPMIRQLQESKERFQLAVSGTNDGLWDWNILTNEEYLSPRLKEILGYENHELENIFQTFTDLLHPDDLERTTKVVNAHLEGRVPYDIEFRLRCKNGQYKWVHSKGQAVWDKNGTPIRMSGTISDITARRKADAELTRVNRVLKAMSECSEALVQSKTEQELLSKICRVLVETGGYRLAWVGYSQSDAEKSILPTASFGIDDGYVEGVKATWADTERGRGPVGTAARTGKPSVVQNDFEDPRFTTWREAAAKRGFAATGSFPLLDRGQPFGVISFYAGEADAFDTDEVHLLMDLSNNLAYGILALRQAEKRKQTAEELLQTKQEAEKANQAKSEFLASMSHELRTPLNAVLGFAQMLQYDPKTPLSPTQNEHVESIIAGGNHLLELVNEVLDLAKIEANQLDLSLEEVSANDVVGECAALTINLGEPRDITIIDHLSGGSLSLLRTDRLRFKQSLINLLSNAVKYNRDGGTVTVEGRETEDGFLRISVKDTGAGIAEEHQSNVFHMFHRLDADPEIAREGTGIGLTVTKLLVEQMAGQVGFESEEGVGSTFWIKLPLASNEDVLIWTDTMRVGIDAIDKDHQVIISLMNRVMHGSVNGGGVDKLIKELIDYTHYHFRREEAIMEVCGDPDLEKHRDYHQTLDARLNELANNWHKDRDPAFLHRLHEFLRDWLFKHVIPDDTDISQYARGKDQDIREALENLE